MENNVENRVKTLITLSEYENKILTILSQHEHISKSKLISNMIEYYIKNIDWIVPKIVYQRESNVVYNNCSKVIKELSEKWKKK